MISVSDEQFEQLVEAAVAAIPARFAERLDNVAFMVADEPTAEQLEAGGEFHDDSAATLLGLYEGIPLPERNDGYNFVLPDVITIFKQSHEAVVSDLAELGDEVRETVWHEVAHYFGLDHGQIEALADDDERPALKR
jgi:predicted Zn-dependent protease with MMP-like domain